jgi:transposase
VENPKLSQSFARSSISTRVCPWSTRCEASKQRVALNYKLDEKTPDHSSFTVIRQRLGLDLYERIFTLNLQALHERGLSRGKTLAMDSSLIEANASLRALVHRNTEEQYWDYVKRLAAESGIDPDDAAAVRKFDHHRPAKGSNQEWANPHDPDAKIGRTKDGATDMLYKPEAVVDLDSGAIVQAQVHMGDQGDHKEMAMRVLEARQNINQAAGDKLDTLTVNTVTSGKGYYAVNELQALQQEEIRTAIADPIDNRRLDKLETDQNKAVQAARHAYRKKLRAYSGLRWNEANDLAWVENLNKRFELTVAFYNLSQLMRKLFGIGTSKQLVACGRFLLLQLTSLLIVVVAIVRRLGLARIRICCAPHRIFPITASQRIDNCNRFGKYRVVQQAARARLRREKMGCLLFQSKLFLGDNVKQVRFRRRSYVTK